VRLHLLPDDFARGLHRRLGPGHSEPHSEHTPLRGERVLMFFNPISGRHNDYSQDCSQQSRTHFCRSGFRHYIMTYGSGSTCEFFHGCGLELLGSQRCGAALPSTRRTRITGVMLRHRDAVQPSASRIAANMPLPDSRVTGSFAFSSARSRNSSGISFKNPDG